MSPHIPPEMKWLTVKDLAEILRLKPQTIYNRLCTQPDSLPPATRVPGFRGLRWSMRMVREWQAQFEPVELLEAPRRPGRPTKADMVARRRLAVYLAK
ncbi:MAG: DNA-binding protein [Rhodospirillaceae bacterium]|nr:DNA-binding protein [Rhodospirillales bacterium]